MSACPTVSVRAILPAEDYDAMARRRGQHPSVFRTAGRHPQWYFRYTIPVLVAPGQYADKECTKYLGDCRSTGKKAAERLRDEFLATINRPEIIIPSQIPMARLLEVYEQSFVSNLKPNSIQGYRSALNAHIRPYFGAMRLCDVSKQSVQAWIGTKRHLAPATRRTILAVLSSVFEQATDWEYLFSRNPAKGIRISDDGGGKRRDTRALTVDELRRLLAAADASDAELGLFLRMGAFCGLRVGEALPLTWADHDPRSQTLRVRASQSQFEGLLTGPKSKSGYRTVPCRPLALQRPLGAKDSDRILREIGTYQTAEYRINTLANKLGMNFYGFGCHTLRATHATLMDRSGARDLREQMGHSNEAMSQHYVRPSLDDHAAAVERIAGMIAITGGKIQ